jgi:zinc transporter ZupT
VIEALAWGAVGASALLIGAPVAFAAAPSPRVIAIVMAVGAGLLIGSVAFELVDEALQTRRQRGLVGWHPAHQLSRRTVVVQRTSHRRMAQARVIRMWVIVIAVAAVSAALGYLVLDPASGRTGAFAQGFAAGALLAMIADTLLPEATTSNACP